MPALCAVIVLYRERAENSLTVRSLRAAISQRPELAGQLLVCLYDNTPAPSPIPEHLFPAETLVFQPGTNSGLPPAYNQALRVAEARGLEWLLLLDSDTEVTADFLGACITKTCELAGTANVAAIVPHVVEGETIHSPRKVANLRRRPVPRGFSGATRDELIALNSGSTIRISAIRSLGGFTSEFWLDYLDYWLFRALQRKGFQVFVLPTSLEHSLSLDDPGRRMSLARYQNMLDAEQYFTFKYGSTWEVVRLKLVLVSRAIRLARSPLTWRYSLLAALKCVRRANREAPRAPIDT
jgi:GT2 family glycosyltransferase